MQNDRAITFDTEVDLHISTSGHYCVEIYPNASIYTNKNKDKLSRNENIIDIDIANW